MRAPRILSHIFDSDSKTATLGFMVFIVASVGLFRRVPNGVVAGHLIDADTWLLCVVIASALIGGKLVAETLTEIVSLRLGKFLPAAPAAAAAPAPAPSSATAAADGAGA